MSEEDLKLLEYVFSLAICEAYSEEIDEISVLQEKIARILKENQKYKEVINRLSKIIYEIDELRKNTGGYPTDYMDNLVNILKEVEDEKN